MLLLNRNQFIKYLFKGSIFIEESSSCEIKTLRGMRMYTQKDNILWEIVTNVTVRQRQSLVSQTLSCNIG